MKIHLPTAFLLCAASVPVRAQVTLVQAIESTLEKNPRIMIEREQVEISRSRALAATGAFDMQLDLQLQQSRINTPLTGLQRLQAQLAGLDFGSQSSNAANGSANLTRQLRSGVQFSSSSSLSRATDNVAQTQGINLSQIRFQVSVPLLRGRGRQVVAAEEIATGIETGAALYDLNQAVSGLISETASRYWELVAARANLEVLLEAEQRGDVLVDTVRQLIAADRMPQAELQQVLANQASRTASRAAAEQRLTEATQALAIAMGLPTGELRRPLDPSDPLPDGEAAAIPSMQPSDVDSWIDRSLTRRADYLSLRTRQGAIEVRRDAAKDRLRPQLDFKFSTGYSGLNEGRRPDRFLYSPFTNVAGVDAIGGIEYSLPLGRRAARGQIGELEATVRQNQFSTADLARNIASSVLAGVAGYTSAVMRVQQARKSVDASQAALEGEREKLRLGVGSVVDLLTIEDRLNNARSAYVDATLNFAVLLTRLRFATGTLVEPNRTSQTVPRAVFYHPPWEDQP